MDTAVLPQYRIVKSADGELTSDGFYPYLIEVDGLLIRDQYNRPRVFSTRNSARKAITRLRRPSGDRHR